MIFKLAGIVKESYVDGPGIRLTVFVQGCNHHCFGCHNKHTWDFNSGIDYDTEEVIKEFDSNSLLSGITFSGGEPMEQPLPLTLIAKHVHSKNKNVWCYTGYTYEDLKCKNDKDINEFLKEIDFLVDGPFDIKRKSLDLKWRGSTNQRILELIEGIAM